MAHRLLATVYLFIYLMLWHIQQWHILQNGKLMLWFMTWLTWHLMHEQSRFAQLFMLPPRWVVKCMHAQVHGIKSGWFFIIGVSISQREPVFRTWMMVGDRDEVTGHIMKSGLQPPLLAWPWNAGDCHSFTVISVIKMFIAYLFWQIIVY